MNIVSNLVALMMVMVMATTMAMVIMLVIFHCEQLQVVQDSGVSPPWLLWAPSHKRTYMMERRILVTRTLMIMMMMMVDLMIIGMIMTEEVGTLQRRFVQLSI